MEILISNILYNIIINIVTIIVNPNKINPLIEKNSDKKLLYNE